MAETRKRRKQSSALIKITIERIENLMKPAREWKQVWETELENRSKYAYVDTTMLREEKLVLLEQSLPESKLDLAKVIKAINSL